nr:hypothetical protein CFP56_19244 [Quercus suber]
MSSHAARGRGDVMCLGDSALTSPAPGVPGQGSSPRSARAYPTIRSVRLTTRTPSDQHSRARCSAVVPLLLLLLLFPVDTHVSPIVHRTHRLTIPIAIPRHPALRPASLAAAGRNSKCDRDGA